MDWRRRSCSVPNIDSAPSQSSRIGNKLVLVDTPGFDDANKTDQEVFQMINDHE
jgi:predicted GTPase